MNGALRHALALSTPRAADAQIGGGGVDSTRRAAYAAFVRSPWLLVLVSLFVLGAAARAQAQLETSCPTGAACVPMPRRVSFVAPERDYGDVAFAAAIVGFASTGLVLSGSVAMAASPRLGESSAVRASWLGTALVALPTVGFSAFAVRQRLQLKGTRRLVLWGVPAWLGGVINGGFQLAMTRDERRVPPHLTVAAGGLAAVGILAFSMDALLTRHRAKIKQGYRLIVTPGGVALRF